MKCHVLRVFCPQSTDDELKDLEIQKKIRQLKWVTRQHLDAAIDLENKKVQELLEDAQNGNDFLAKYLASWSYACVYISLGNCVRAKRKLSDWSAIGSLPTLLKFCFYFQILLR